jgi:UPF0716 protein FxsA
MFALMLLAFIAVPVVEIYVIVQVGQEIGALNTVALLLVVSVVGAWLAKREGLSVLTRLRRQLDDGRVPANELIDGGLVLAGGLLLLTPGFVTDVAGILLLLPPTRAALRHALKRRFRVRVYRFGGVRPPSVRPYRRDGGPEDVIDV